MACCKCEWFKWADPQEPVWTDPAGGNEYCVFHAPKEHKLDLAGRPFSVDEFNALVSERIQATVDLANTTAWCDLRGTVFPGRVDFVIPGPFPLISFHSARFESAANFSSATFDMNADFWNVRFEGEANFSYATFGGAWISGTQASGMRNSGTRVSEGTRNSVTRPSREAQIS
jgi:uncharacterized protein YjbI with pentapeptide repeats